MIPAPVFRIGSVEEALRDEFRNLSLARQEFPILTDWGVEDFSETVHSMGINYLTQMGGQLGFIGTSEYPVRLRDPRVVSGSAQRWVVPDSVWWDRASRRAVFACEFERYAPGGGKRQDLQSKVRNLLLAHRELGAGPRLLLLMLWTVSGVPVEDTAELTSLIRNGFSFTNGANVAGLEPDSRFLLVSAVFASHQGKVRLKEVLL